MLDKGREIDTQVDEKPGASRLIPSAILGPNAAGDNRIRRCPQPKCARPGPTTVAGRKVYADT